jgi:hypothetical protein
MHSNEINGSEPLRKKAKRHEMHGSQLKLLEEEEGKIREMSLT